MPLNAGHITPDGDWSPADQDSLAKRLEEKLVARGVIEIHAGSDPGKSQRRHFLLALSEAIIEHFQTHGEIIYDPHPVSGVEQFSVTVDPSPTGGPGHSHGVTKTLSFKHFPSPGKIK